MILVSEIGDKTFFIAAILAMTNTKLVVFLAALSTLYIMTIDICDNLKYTILTVDLDQKTTY